MIVKIPKQRQNSGTRNKPFNDLVNYIEENQGHELTPLPQINADLSKLIDYTTNSIDKLTNVDKCLAVRIHRLTAISTASAEMNAVAAQNRRCKDPAYHFILSWPEHEQPPAEAIFDAAEHAIRALGLQEHQYIIAIHGNTDNRHCHVAINRVHPSTFKSHHIEWAEKTLHFAARQSEIKHGWTHDKGIYIVHVDGQGNKTIVLNPEHAAAVSRALPPEQRNEIEALLPTWHDQESLETWLRTVVNHPIKKALDGFQNWHGLHAWLNQRGITLKDTGGGGMRIVATSATTGEILEVPVSRGLRVLKRQDLEKRWGPFVPPATVSSIVPDSSHLSQNQLLQGAQRVIDRNLYVRTPYDNLLHPAEDSRRIASARSGRLHELPGRHVVSGGSDPEMPLPDSLLDRMGDGERGTDQGLRRAGDGTGRGQGVARGRDQSKREKRRAERAAARADLRHRYGQYRRFVHEHDAEYASGLTAIHADRRKTVAALMRESRAAKRAVRKESAGSANALISIVAIDQETVQRKLEIDIRHKQRVAEHRATRPPALGWREWLQEQANLGDQAAISALRGIVYQARRDAKHADEPAIDDFDDERAARDANYRQEQHRKIIARLIDEEKREIAIRAARTDAMRSHEIDALLVRYAGIQWRVTGNGNIEYSDSAGAHLFTDRGNRLTFDRARVSDDEIRLALVHSQQKFGRCITLTGDDRIFTERMARLADDLGMTVLNPDLASVVSRHRKERLQRTIDTSGIPTPQRAPSTQPAPSIATETAIPIPTPIAHVPIDVLSDEDRLRAKVLAIDPRATFLAPNTDNQQYAGPAIAAEDKESFAQHIGRSRYVIHIIAMPAHDPNAIIEVRYRDGQPAVGIIQPAKGKGHGRG